MWGRRGDDVGTAGGPADAQLERLCIKPTAKRPANFPVLLRAGQPVRPCTSSGPLGVVPGPATVPGDRPAMNPGQSLQRSPSTTQGDPGSRRQRGGAGGPAPPAPSLVATKGKRSDSLCRTRECQRRQRPGFPAWVCQGSSEHKEGRPNPVPPLHGPGVSPVQGPRYAPPGTLWPPPSLSGAANSLGWGPTGLGSQIRSKSGSLLALAIRGLHQSHAPPPPIFHLHLPSPASSAAPGWGEVLGSHPRTPSSARPTSPHNRVCL